MTIVRTVPFPDARPVGVALAAAMATADAGDAPADADRYAKIVADPIRTDQDRKMDASRHPPEFLPFTQAKPGMMALDVSAGAGYTSQLIALVVAPTASCGRRRRARARRSKSGSAIIRSRTWSSSSGPSRTRCRRTRHRST